MQPLLYVILVVKETDYIMFDQSSALNTLPVECLSDIDPTALF